jgi:hypothetical protein
MVARNKVRPAIGDNRARRRRSQQRGLVNTAVQEFETRCPRMDGKRDRDFHPGETAANPPHSSVSLARP